MSRIKSWIAKTAHSLSGHLDRLRETLERLHGRLREAIAEAVSGSTASAVKDAVLTAMLASEVATAYEPQSYRASSAAYDKSRYSYGSYRQSSTDDPCRPSWQRDPYDDDPDRYEPGEIDEPRTEPLSQPSPESVGRRFGQAVAVGCQAAVWWLRRKTNGRYSALVAIGVGATAGVTAYFVGPVIAAAAFAGSALGLTSLSQAARHSAAVLFGVASS